MATQNEIAKHIDLSSRKVRDYMADGILSKGGDLDVCRVAYIRYLREVAAGRSTNSANYTAERTRLAKAQADEKELQVKQLQGDLIPADAVLAEWRKMLSSMRSRLLAIPPRAAVLMPGIETFREAEKILKKFIYEALTELSGDGLPAEHQKEQMENEAKKT